MSDLISDSIAWKRLQEHAETIKSTTHLRDLLQDEKRSQVMQVEQNGILLDFARQNATIKTLDLLFDLAEAAKLRQKLVRSYI
jgi:glucose-6-phosphate isomerase